MKKFNIVLLLSLLFLFSCNSNSQLESIHIKLSKEKLNPVQEPGVTSEIEIEGTYSDGKKAILPLNQVAISVKTKNSSGNVCVAKYENQKIVPLEGGVAEVSAVFSKDGHTFFDKKQLIVRPYYRDYHKSLVLKLFMAYDGKPLNNNDPWSTLKNRSCICSFKEALDVVKRVDNLTKGIPKIIYLVGWQRGGHDHLFPDWSIVNENLKRDEDKNALESLRWLIKEAKNYNTTVSLHINMVDAFEESPLWSEYVKNDVISKDETGKLLPVWENIENHKAYHISYTKEWNKGLTKKRIDKLIDMIPELKEGHTIHIDAFIAYWQPDNWELSPYLAKYEGIDRYKEVETMRKIFKYWREKGFDVTGEGLFWAHPAGEGFVGLQPWSWWYPPNNVKYQMDIPECLSARGETDRNGQGDFRFGSSMHGEDIFLKDKENLSGFLDQFCTMTLPWLYLSQSDRVDFIDETLYYSNGIIARMENGHKIIRKGKIILRDDDDLFVPASWHENEIIAYSKNGYEYRKWIMPDSWKKIKSVNVYSITINGDKLKNRAVKLDGGKMELSLQKGEAVRIIPTNKK